MEFTKIYNVSKTQLSIILSARFIMIIIWIQYLFLPARMIIKKHLKKDLSMIKVVRYLINNSSKIIAIVKELINYKRKYTYHLKALGRYCTYKKRKRMDFEQEFLASIS